MGQTEKKMKGGTVQTKTPEATMLVESCVFGCSVRRRDDEEKNPGFQKNFLKTRIFLDVGQTLKKILVFR